jgi:uncharacterized protein YqeY
MTLQEQLRLDLKEAMRAGDTLKRDVIRMLESTAKNLAIEKKLDRQMMADSLVLEAIKKAVKQRKDSIQQFEQGGRADLAEQEKAELAILAFYLPESLSEDIVRERAIEVIASLGTVTPADFGKVMGKVMATMNGQAEGDVVKKVVQELLG